MNITIEKRHAVIGGVILVLLLSGLLWMSSAGSRNPDWLAREYGIDNAFSNVVETPDGKVPASLVPIQLADGSTAYLVVPQKKGSQQLYLQDESGVYPVAAPEKGDSREDFMRSEPVIMESQPAAAPAQTAPKRKRSTEKEVLIVAGSAGAGAAIGGIAGGKKGAAVGAVSGGVAGLVYDLATRDKK
jgi:hypothetical protein